MNKKRSYAHKKAQILGKVRDNFTCQVCGSKTNVQGHHIFDYIFKGAATSDNIITLCKHCHNNVHKWLLDIIKF